MSAVRSTEGKKRRALTPLIAEVILIAVTLIAAMALAGFVFGVMGTYSRTAEVSAGAASCTTISPATCTVNLTNTGTSNTKVTACSLRFSTTTPGTAGGAAATNIGAGGGAVQATCALATAGGAVGSPVVGSFALSNGGTVQFTGTWQ